MLNKVISNYNFIDNNGVKLYIRHIPSVKKTNQAIILMNSRTLCVESSMGISMGSISYGDYIANQGIETFLVDLRGFGMSDTISELVNESLNDIVKPTTTYDYFSDIVAVADYIRNLLGPGTEISIVGFSYLAALSLAVSHYNPGIFKNVILLNPNYFRPNDSPQKNFEFIDQLDDNAPYSVVDLYKIKQRLEVAQPANKNFTEPLWFNEASDSLEKYHKSFDKETKTWRVYRPSSLNDDLKNCNKMRNSSSNVLIISSQYDTENHFFVIKKMYSDISVRNKYLKILPNATHLCIWEKARFELYDYTTRFIL